MMNKKILYFDVETTGLDAKFNEIIQIAYIIEVDGIIKHRGNRLMRPTNMLNVSPKALEITGKTLEEIEKYPVQESQFVRFSDDLGKYVDKFNPSDKYYVCGYNVKFDLDFLFAWFKKNNDDYLGSWLNWKTLDPLQILYLLDSTGRINLHNYKLETVCKYFKIEIDAHDALSDIKATKLLYRKLVKDYFSFPPVKIKD